MTTSTTYPGQVAYVPARAGTLYDVMELILDRGMVIDVFVRVSLVGIEILKIDARIVVASVDTYLRFAEACNRLDLESDPDSSTVPELFGGGAAKAAGRRKAGRAVRAAGRKVREVTGGEPEQEQEDNDEEEATAQQRKKSRDTASRTPARRKAVS